MKVHISGMASSNLELEVPHPKEIRTKNLFASVYGVSSYRYVKMAFSSLKYTVVCRTPLVS